MNKLYKSLIALVIVFGLQLIVYLFLFHPSIVRWGTTKQEISMPIPGDKYAEGINSTRAITIQQPSDKVWKYLVDLGADRRGFYSYDFIEKIVGCEFSKTMNEENHHLEVGRIISGDTAGTSQFAFKVIEVTQGQSMVLEHWGGFLVKPIDANNTRLIIRTHAKKPTHVFEWFNASVFDAMHHIMEKRMMLGIKDLAEMNGKYTSTNDFIWLLCIFASGLGGVVLIFIYKGYNKLIFPSIFYLVWQLVLLILNPVLLAGVFILILTGSMLLIPFYKKE